MLQYQQQWMGNYEQAMIKKSEAATPVINEISRKIVKEKRCQSARGVPSYQQPAKSQLSPYKHKPTSSGVFDRLHAEAVKKQKHQQMNDQKHQRNNSSFVPGQS